MLPGQLALCEAACMSRCRHENLGGYYICHGFYGRGYIIGRWRRPEGGDCSFYHFYDFYGYYGLFEFFVIGYVTRTGGAGTWLYV